MALLKLKSNITPDGRKYRMGLLFAAAMILGLAIASQNSVIENLYSEFLTGLAGIYLVYCGGNVSNKWVLGKNGIKMGVNDEELPPTSNEK